MATSKKSIGKKLKDPTSSAAVTRVSLSVRQVNGEVKKTHGICGHGLEKPLANYDPDTQSWKMFGDISLWGDCPLLVNLPPSGMTQNGVLFLQHPWEPIIGETESLSWPTPRANVAMASLITPEIANNPNRQPNLETVVGRRLWPTPTAHPDNSNKNGKFKNPTLGDAVKMWPTPTTQETEHPDAMLTETGRRLSKDGKTSHSLGLADAVKMWPTPTYGKLAGGTGGMQQIEAQYLAGNINSEERRAMRAGNGGKLNPMWVEWLMGFPPGWTDLEDSGTP
jgi:DNA (cytosine-5)-methyltransferase 1